MNATKCINGNRHRWQVIAFEYVEYGPSSETIWCSVCGSIAERTRARGDGRFRRCLNDDGSVFVEHPTNESVTP